MSTYLVDFDKETQDFNYENLLIDNKLEINKDTYKYFIYYVDKNSAKEIYIKTPKIRLIYNWSNLKYYHLKIKITPLYDKTNAFIEFIKKLEEEIIIKLPIKKKNKLEFKSLIEENNSYYLKTFYDENKIKITSDLNKTYKLTDFKANAEIQLVIKLNNIWQKNGSYGISSQLYQIKYYAPPEDHDLNFFDEVKYIPIKKIESKLENKVEETEKHPIKIPFMIDPKMLQSIKLKPVDPK